MLRKRIEPLMVDRSTFFMVVASLNCTDGKVSPTAMGVPSNLKGFPFMATELPGSMEP
jgi:hypothetical protein